MKKWDGPKISKVALSFSSETNFPHKVSVQFYPTGALLVYAQEQTGPAVNTKSVSKTENHNKTIKKILRLKICRF